jgi:hypothetical protein
MGFSGARLAYQQDWFGLGHIIAFRQRAQLSGRDAGTFKFERIQGLHPRQLRFM